MSSPRSSKRKNGLSAAATRFKLVLDQLFEGNQSRMAEAIRISQPMISSIVKGRHEPGGQALAKLASLPTLIPAWVYSGQGEPFRVKRNRGVDSPAQTLALPIAKIPLSSSPEDKKARFNGEVYPVTPESFATTRYWLEVNPSECFTPEVIQECRLFERDLILIETDDEVIHDVGHIVDRLCIVSGEKNLPRIARVQWDLGPETGAHAGLLAQFLGRTLPKCRKGSNDANSSRFQERFANRLADPLTVEQVLGVAVLIVRRTVC